MITEQFDNGLLIIDPAMAWVHYSKGVLMLEVPLQYKRNDGQVDVSSVYLGTESMDVVVQEAHRWAAGRAESARSEGNVSP